MEPGLTGQHGLHVLLPVVVENMKDHVTAAILFLSMVEIIALEKHWKSKCVIMTLVLQVRNEHVDMIAATGDDPLHTGECIRRFAGIYAY